MIRPDLDPFLQWALPRLRLRLAGYRRVRRQVGRRLRARQRELGLTDLAAYRARLESDPREWKVLDQACRVTLSRFWRDGATWDALLDSGLPQAAALARGAGERTVRAWSAGCASGEEPHSLLLAWALGGGSALGGFELEVVATDADERLLERARMGLYPEAALRELPAEWREAAFEEADGRLAIRAAFRRGLRFERRDVRAEPPEGRFELVLCRNLAFTYFDESLQLEVLDRVAEALRPGGLLVLGRHERLPTGQGLFEPWSEGEPQLWRRRAADRHDAPVGLSA